jgi:hypothetical protein
MSNRADRRAASRATASHLFRERQPVHDFCGSAKSRSTKQSSGWLRRRIGANGSMLRVWNGRSALHCSDICQTAINQRPGYRSVRRLLALPSLSASRNTWTQAPADFLPRGRNSEAVTQSAIVFRACNDANVLSRCKIQRPVKIALQRVSTAFPHFQSGHQSCHQCNKLRLSADVEFTHA